MREIKFDYMIKKENSDEVHHCGYTLGQLEDSILLTSIRESGRIIAKRQYTGLKDKNGVEIYEGDIVKTQLHHAEVCHGWFKEDITPSETQTLYGWFIKDGSWQFNLNEHLKVIGNIYENPELLERK